MTRWLAAVVMCIVGSGCGPARLLPAPAGWPAEWHQRRLYHTAHAYIYAGNGAAAREADDLARRVWREFEQRTGGRAGKGLLVVTRIAEPPALEDYMELCRVLARHDAAAQGVALSPAALTQRCDAVLAALRDQGLDPDLELRLTPVTLDRGDVVETLHLPEAVGAVVPWAVALPTGSLIRRSNREGVRHELEEKRIGPLLQVPLAPVTAFEEGVRNAKALVARDVALFRNHALQQSGWDANRRDEHTQAYMNRRLDESLRPVLTLLGDVVEVVAAPLGPPANSTPTSGGQAK